MTDVSEHVLELLHDLRRGDVVISGRLVGVVTGASQGWGTYWLNCKGVPLSYQHSDRYAVQVTDALDILIPAGTRTLPLLCACLPVGEVGPQCCPRPPAPPVSWDDQPTPRKVPIGAEVTYRGSLAEHHGRYVVGRRCRCPQECLDNDFAEYRYELHGGPGLVLEHVRRSSIEYRA